jgi:RecA-family ATPase
VTHLDTTAQNRDPAIDDDLSRFTPVDWYQVWEDEPDDIQWLLQPVLERGTANAIYSEPGMGKSLISQEISAGIAKGGEVVVYIDSENRRLDWKDRLRRMGYSPDVLQNLKLYTFPELPALDSRKGGDIVLRIAQRDNAALVIIDTTMRFVDGRENDSDTFNDLYKHTMIPLKGAGITSLRLDHSGKDSSKGQRGSSGKSGDVDTVWRLSHPQNGKNRWLDKEKDRTGHCPDKIRLEIIEHPRLEHAWHWDRDYLTSTPYDDAAAQKNLSALEILDDLEIPVTWGREKIRQVLTEHGIKMDTTVLTSAIKERKLSAESLRQVPDR